jgi:formylglycine-generating enzyme required for sulfatase activity
MIVPSARPRYGFVPALALAGLVAFASAPAQEAKPAVPQKPEDFPAVEKIKGHDRYEETIPGTDIKFRMAPIPGGKFKMSSPADEAGRQENEGDGPVEVELSPFWMGTHEVTWQEFDVFAFSFDVKTAKEAEKSGKPLKRTPFDLKADAVTRPTPPYVDMTFGYGHDGYPAICMTHNAATKYCEWLSAKTGRKYRLPTEAEWEYAARAGSTTKFHWGDDAEKFGDHEWFAGNSNEKPQPVGLKKPNKWGLYDIHGNVYEWTKDKYVADYHKRITKEGSLKVVKNPTLQTTETKWSTARGGSWRDDPELCRSAVRTGAEEDWSIQDPQQPRSIWWHTDAHWVGIRVVRELDKGEANGK